MHRQLRRGFTAIVFCALFAGAGCVDTDPEPTTLMIGPRQARRSLKISEMQVVMNRPGVEVGWKTDAYSDSAIYLNAGSPPADGLIAPTEYYPDLLIQHWISLDNLTPATTYYFYVISRDESGNTVVSDVRTFQTPL